MKRLSWASVLLPLVVACGNSTPSGESSPAATDTGSPASVSAPSTAPPTTDIPADSTSTSQAPTTPTTSAGPPVLAASPAFSLPDGFMYPEGAAFDPATGRVYVTSIQSGAVAVAEPGSDTATVWLEAGSDGRDLSALGIEFGDGRVWIVSNGAVYEYRTDGTLIGRHDPIGPAGGGLNDVTVTDDAVYVSDSEVSLVWYLPLDASADAPLQPIDIGAVNAEAAEDAFNGIEALPDGTLVAGQYSGTQLFHIDPRVPSAVVIDLGDGYVTQVGPSGSSRQVRYAGTDGMSLDGNVLWTSNTTGNAVDRITLCPSFDCGTVVAGASDPLLSFPTDVQVAGDVVLVVNSQFPGLIGALEPTLPFTVAAIPITSS